MFCPGQQLTLSQKQKEADYLKPMPRQKPADPRSAADSDHCNRTVLDQLNQENHSEAVSRNMHLHPSQNQIQAECH